jgi:hypothetical protein
MLNLSDQLKSVQLRKVTKQIRDFSSPKLAGFLTKDECSSYQNEVLNCNFEKWFDLLKECTFETKFSPITYEDACLFVRIYETFFKDKDLLSLESIKWKENLNEQDKINLNAIRYRLENEMSAFLKADNCVFIKTSSRSAKDSPLATNMFKNLYSNYLSSSEDPINENIQITCLLKAAFDCLKITNVDEAIEMIVKSERIYQDMLLAIENPSRFKENFVVRKFYDIDVDMEFRGFVYDMKLNALSQYNYLIWSKRLVENKDLIQRLIIDYFNNKVLPILREAQFEKNFIIDFAVFSSNYSKFLTILITQILKQDLVLVFSK